jgi:hypothetical protein
VLCCYLLELLSSEDIARTSGQVPSRTAFEETAGAGDDRRQVEQRVPELIAASDFRIISEQVVRQAFYPSRVLVARK